MDKTADTRAREERLAAKLRENLKRRKTQARTIQAGEREPHSREAAGRESGTPASAGDE